MTDCDVCIGGTCDEYPELSETKVKTARVQHKCCECGRLIIKGQSYEHCVMKYEGDWLSYKTCMLCVEIRNVFTCGNGWMFESLWNDMEEYAFDRLTTASPCFTKLSPEAKKFVLARWREWKGLAA
jgi:hypothetical protein